MIIVVKNVRLKSIPDSFEGFSIQEDEVSRVMDSIDKAIKAFDIGEETATVTINYDSFTSNPHIQVDIKAGSEAMLDKIQAIVDSAY